jgi:hypothetical protein
MQFNRDEFLLLSRRGSVPSARSTGPPGGPPSPRRRLRKQRRTGRLRSLSQAVRSSLTTRRAPVGRVQGYRRDR